MIEPAGFATLARIYLYLARRLRVRHLAHSDKRKDGSGGADQPRFRSLGSPRLLPKRQVATTTPDAPAGPAATPRAVREDWLIGMDY